MRLPVRASYASSTTSSTSCDGTDEVRVAEAPELRFFPLTGGEPGEEDLALLDEEEQRRAARLRSRADRACYVAAHAFLRRLVGERLGVAPQGVTVVREPCPCCGAPRGRPAVGGSTGPLHFSLSRSGEWALIAIAREPVGVDIEALPPPETVAEVSGVLHPSERAEIVSAPADVRAEVFARIWTR